MMVYGDDENGVRTRWALWAVMFLSEHPPRWRHSVSGIFVEEENVVEIKISLVVSVQIHCVVQI